MKAKVLFAVLVFVLGVSVGKAIACGFEGKTKRESASGPIFMSPAILMSQTESLVEKTIKVDGMDCAKCARAIEKEVSKISGVVEVKADYKAGTCKVKMKSGVDVQQVFKAIEKAGFKPVGEI
ncbi:hypothetical protein HRbin19_01717 [bacterium HR19]|nr:hypothetical protein HRbin19_01717 [bacterium HR19]